MAEEWGPWVKHDGTRVPVPVGTICFVQHRAGAQGEICVSGAFLKWGNAFVWASMPEDLAEAHIVRYRIRRPDALRRLIDLAADPDQGLPPRFPVEELA